MPAGKTELNILFTAVSPSISPSFIGITCQNQEAVIVFKHAAIQCMSS